MKILSKAEGNEEDAWHQRFQQKHGTATEKTLGGMPRTMNTCEVWHRHLNTIVGKHHPFFYHVVEELQAEVVIDENIEQLGGGHSPPKRRPS